MPSVPTAPIPEALRRQQQIVKALSTEDMVASPKSPVSSMSAEEIVSVPAADVTDNGFGRFSQLKIEELVIALDSWEFRIKTPFVSENAFTFSFGFDEQQLGITPKFEAACEITYRGNKFPAIFGGGNIKFPGMPFTILSFFKDNQEPKT